ncbi:hypothetical protein apy_02870 [Aeropyrum pernix]|uniref:Uncharacterized protein n=1 Tax=Aeropyrum pernix TaxID=56636 RepID=A0A401H895_AERPX|nr:hypothetical protein apy_02870 [Aeropyrum pernix]
MAGPPGFEPGTTGCPRAASVGPSPRPRLEGRRSVLAELRARSEWFILYAWSLYSMEALGLLDPKPRRGWRGPRLP